MSESVEELLQNGPVVMDSDRCSYLLEQQTATHCDWHRCEDAATLVGRRLSSRDGLYPIPTLRGECSDYPGKTLTEQRHLTNKISWVRQPVLSGTSRTVVTKVFL